LANPVRLLELQKMDSTWEKIRRRLLQIQKLTVEPDSVRAQREQVARTETELHEWHARQRNAELESQSLQTRIQTSEQKLMSGSVRNPKELEALQSSIEALRRQRSHVEEQGVEALLQVEQLTALLASERKALSSAESEWQGRHAELLAEEAKLKRHGVHLKGQRAAAVALLPVGDVAIYEDLRKRKAGVAVTEISNGMCSACNVRIPTGVVSAAKSGTELVYCPSCGRILAAG